MYIVCCTVRDVVRISDSLSSRRTRYWSPQRDATLCDLHCELRSSFVSRLQQPLRARSSWAFRAVLSRVTMVQYSANGTVMIFGWLRSSISWPNKAHSAVSHLFDTSWHCVTRLTSTFVTWFKRGGSSAGMQSKESRRWHSLLAVAQIFDLYSKTVRILKLNLGVKSEWRSSDMLRAGSCTFWLFQCGGGFLFPHVH